MGNLTTVTIKNARPSERPRKMADGKGLYLLVTPAGGKLWRYDYRIAGKRGTLALGSWPDVSLADARIAHGEAYAKVLAGIEPSRRNLSDRTFKEVAEAWWESRKPAWAPRYANNIRSRLQADFYETIGPKPICEITSTAILDVLRAIQSRGAIETGRRMRGIVGEIFDYAVGEGIVSSNPTEKMSKALASSPPRTRRAALKLSDLPTFFNRLTDYELEPMTRDALLLTVYTAVRTGETLGARVEEFEGLDRPEPVWRIPPERMKMGAEHLVPLTPVVVEIVNRWVKGRTSGLLFPRSTKSATMSQNTMLFAMYRLGYHGRATVHGFRGTFSTTANEAGWNSEWVERQLAHVERNQVRGAYNAAEYLVGRRQLMIWWSDLLDAQAEIGRLLG